MRINFRQIFYIFLLGSVFAQFDVYRNIEAIEDEWKGYTSYQKEEALSFCDFLFKEGYYERCLLNAFQVLYRFPNDQVTSVLNYYIARCYEEMANYKLAKDYYAKVLKSKSKDSIAYKASVYRSIYVTLMMGDYDDVLRQTDTINDDPYLVTFKGYAHINKLNWEEARTSFISAQSNFSHPHYDKLITPIYQAIEEVHTIPKHNRYLVFLMSTLLPGGGQFILGEKGKGQGIFSSVGLMMLISSWTGVEKLVGNSRAVDNISTSIPMHKDYDDGTNKHLIKKNQLPKEISTSSSSTKYIIPPLLIGVGVFIASSYSSFKDTQSKNKELIEIYVKEKLYNLPSQRFLDFPEPQLINKK